MNPEQLPNNAEGSASFAELVRGMERFYQKNLALQIKLVAPGEEELGPYILSDELAQTQANGLTLIVPRELIFVSTVTGNPIFPSNEMRQVWRSYDHHLITSPSLRGVCPSRYHHLLVGDNHNFLRKEELTAEQLKRLDRNKDYCPVCQRKEKRRSHRNTAITICAVIGSIWLLSKVPPEWLPKDPGPPAGMEQPVAPPRPRK